MIGWQEIWNGLQNAGKVVPVVTAAVVLSAAYIALQSIKAQKSIARKRAAIDFFLKTETDSYMLKAWKEFDEARHVVKDCDDISEFEKTTHWTPLRNYLNLHELIAVGVKQQVLDDSVCFDFWRAELHRACRDCRKAIDHIQSKPDEKLTYIELVALYKEWNERHQKR